MMKHVFGLAAGLACCCAAWTSTVVADEAGKPSAEPVRIGVYDSRALAYAHFWSPECERQRQELSKTARDAKTAGQQDRFKELDARLKKLQDQIHLQVFSTAPVDDVLAGMKPQLTAVQQKTGVSRFVSKWDQSTLDQFKKGTRIDVTDQLLGGFKLNEKQKKVVEDLHKKKPLPLDEAKALLREGKL
jgi:hypothetical protein